MAGKLNTTNYTINKAIVMFEKEGTTGFVDLGNAPAYTVTKEVETVEHFSSREGPKKRDKLVVTQQKGTGALTLDVPDAQNLNLFFMGDGTNDTSQLSAINDDSDLLRAELDCWQQIQKSLVNIYDLSDTRVFLGATTYVEGLDYELLLRAGMIRTFSAGTIVQNQFITVEHDKAAIAEINTIKACKSKTVRGLLKVVGDPDCGSVMDIIGFASITPAGEIPFIGDEVISFDLAVEYVEEPTSGIDGLFEVTHRAVVVA